MRQWPTGANFAKSTVLIREREEQWISL